MTELSYTRGGVCPMCAGADVLPFELTRGGFTWGCERPIADSDVVAMFVLDGKICPRLWVEQDFPQLDDLVSAGSVGADGDAEELLAVRARIWRTSNLLMVGCGRRAADDGDPT